MIVVYHLLPSLAVGGIETMATRFMAECPDDIDYRLIVLSKEGPLDIPLTKQLKTKVEYLGSTNSPITDIRAAMRVLAISDSVVVSSTWRAAIVVWLAKRMGSIPHHVAFTHRSSVAHSIDRLLRTWQVHNCVFNIADSESAANWVRNATGCENVAVLQPIFSPPKALEKRDSRMRICFIGRLAPVKNIEWVCQLVEKISVLGLPFTFHIYGPDAGSKVQLDRWIKEHADVHFVSGLVVEYCGSLAPEAVHRIAA